MTATCALPPEPRGMGKKRGYAMGPRRGPSGPARPQLPPPAARPWRPVHGKQLSHFMPSVSQCYKVRLTPYMPRGNLLATDFLRMIRRHNVPSLSEDSDS